MSSRNFFIDSSSDRQGGKGDDLTIQMGGDSLRCESGQQLKLTLREFSMYNTMYSVNVNNSKIKVTTNVAEAEGEVPFGNYATLGDITTAFASKIAQIALADAQAGGSSATVCSTVDITPNPQSTLSSTGQRLMSFTLRFDHAHGLTTFLLQSDNQVRHHFIPAECVRLCSPSGA